MTEWALTDEETGRPFAVLQSQASDYDDTNARGVARRIEGASSAVVDEVEPRALDTERHLAHTG